MPGFLATPAAGAASGTTGMAAPGTAGALAGIASPGTAPGAGPSPVPLPGQAPAPGPGPGPAPLPGQSPPPTAGHAPGHVPVPAPGHVPLRKLPAPVGGLGAPYETAPAPVLQYGTPAERLAGAARRIAEAEGAVLVVTSSPALWAETKDARAKLGPVLLYDPSHLCDTPARMHWHPGSGCTDRETAAARAVALLAPVRPQARIDAAVADTAETPCGAGCTRRRSTTARSSRSTGGPRAAAPTNPSGSCAPTRRPRRVWPASSRTPSPPTPNAARSPRR